eukprot:CAMPEP_0196717086 /NCGR_PEP_ID=MMETSP1091-20130531/502_1 /TAXON_ID=302021 /ORGANISM="Rhodomonas sp., Strain CCMP768" /LENGTH=155 /DNA_ID=CAMNT_0042057311 /DNA_START=35 /DNA_END=502 /DNA_ORIENTATION=+
MAAAGRPGQHRAAKRIERELADLVKEASFPVEVVGDACHRWIVHVAGAQGTFYQGETFRLQFTFPDNYPIEAPEVIFLPAPPVHPHIYSNGHICLSILYDAWSPALRVDSICVSIVSMLSSATEKSPPSDNDRYVSRCGTKSPKQTAWAFHDDKA